MKHIYNLFIFLCVSLTLWSCKDSEEIAQASLTLNNNELSFTGFRSSLPSKWMPPAAGTPFRPTTGSA